MLSNPETIFARVNDFCTAACKRPHTVDFPTEFSGSTDINSEHAESYAFLNGPKTVLSNGQRVWVACGGKVKRMMFAFAN